MKGYVARKGDRWYAVIYEGPTRSAGGNAGAGIPPAPSGPTPNASPPDLPANTSSPTTRRGR